MFPQALYGFYKHCIGPIEKNMQYFVFFTTWDINWPIIILIDDQSWKILKMPIPNLNINMHFKWTRITAPKAFHFLSGSESKN